MERLYNILLAIFFSLKSKLIFQITSYKKLTCLKYTLLVFIIDFAYLQYLDKVSSDWWRRFSSLVLRSNSICTSKRRWEKLFYISWLMSLRLLLIRDYFVILACIKRLLLVYSTTFSIKKTSSIFIYLGYVR